MKDALHKSAHTELGSIQQLAQELMFVQTEQHKLAETMELKHALMALGDLAAEKVFLAAHNLGQITTIQMQR